MREQITEGAQILAAKTATYGGSATAVGGGFWAFFGSIAPQVGALCAIIGCVVSCIGAYWLVKHKKLEIEIGKAKLEALRKEAAR